MRFFSSTVGALGEAWAELRTHKLRVFLSLIGIAVAVGALTAVVALGEYQKQAYIEQSDRYGGRVALLSVNTLATDGSPVNWEEVDRRFVRAAERFDFGHASRIVPDGYVTLPVQLPEGVEQIPARLMDPAYPAMHRLSLLEGRWFESTDRELLAPPVVISEGLWDMIGRVPIDQHPTLQMTGDHAGTYTVIGVTPREGYWDTYPRVEMLLDHYRAQVGVLPETVQVVWEVWIPEELVADIAPAFAMDLRAQLPTGLELSVNRTDWRAQAGFQESLDMSQLITGSIAGLVLLLGGLSLVNIQLVAMRQRIREIGVRRSFGASGARIFASVMLESIVATAVAGAAGIALAVALMRTPMVTEQLVMGLQDVPAFPLQAALIGLVASVAVGALAGLVPAIVALRIRVIDAIRF